MMPVTRIVGSESPPKVRTLSIRLPVGVLAIAARGWSAADAAQNAAEMLHKDSEVGSCKKLPLPLHCLLSSTLSLFKFFNEAGLNFMP